MKTRAIIVSLSENLINEPFANFESLLRALLEGTQPEVMSLVHGSRLLLAEVNCAWPRLCVSKIDEDLLARCVDENFVVSEQVCLLRMKAIRPMYLI
jgi:hypothetical protein